MRIEDVIARRIRGPGCRVQQTPWLALRCVERMPQAG
jgi:hypothetical protein